MRLRLSFEERLSLVLLGALLVVTALFYPRLPDTIPIHFGLDGEPDRWGSRAHLFALPALLTGVLLFMRRVALPSLGRTNAAASRFTLLLVVAAACPLQVLVLRAAMGYPFATGVVAAVLGGLFIGIGLWMPRLRPNRVIGIRTSATLASEEVWVRTHRIGGAVTTMAGVATLLLSLVSPAAAVVLMTAVSLSLIPLSFIVSRQRA